MSETDNALIFHKLKPYCVKIAKNCSVKDIDELETVLSSISGSSLTAFQDYVLFPFYVVQKRNIHENLLIRIIDFLTFFFKKCPISSTDCFNVNFSLLINYLPREQAQVLTSSEEIKNSICVCISSLIENSTEEVLFYIFKTQFSLVLAQTFYTLIGLLKNERSKALRQNVLLTMGTLLGFGSYTSPWSRDLENSASSSISTIFPGICVALVNVACGDAKQGHLVISIALKTLGKLVVLVLGDHIKVLNDSVDENNDVPCVVRNEEWFQGVISKLEIVMQNCTILVNQEHWKVRLELVAFCEVILFSCLNRFKTSISILLPAVFALSVDTNQQVSEKSKSLIENFSCHFHSLNSVPLISIVKDDILKSSSKLIKSKLSLNDSEKLLILKSIQGYIQILSKSLNDLLFSVPHLEKLILSLLNLLEFDTAKVNLVEETRSDWNDQSIHKKWPKKYFQHFHSEDILKSVQSICYCLGKFGHVRLLVDYLLEKSKDSKIFSLQIIFLIGCFVEGLGDTLNPAADCCGIISDVIDQIFSPEQWESVPEDRTVKVYEEIVDFSSNKVYSGYSLYHNCLALEVIEKCSLSIGKEFKIFLNQVLFHVMERAGSSNYIVSQAGKLCLHSISHACGYSSVAELIRENADYLVNGITLSFHHFTERPETAVVLRIIIEESDEKILYLIRDCIYNILSILDCNQHKAYLLLIVIKSITIAIHKWLKTANTSEHIDRHKSAENLKLYFLDKKVKQEALDQSLNEDNDEGTIFDHANVSSSDAGVEDFDTKKLIPLHVNLLCEILTRCIHLQSSCHLHTQVISLEITELCVLALKGNKNQLHPLIHEFWDPFMQRFTEDSVVVLEAFKVLLVIADECQDFVRARVLKDVVPKMINFLKVNFSSSKMKIKFCDYQWTNICKLQVHLLNNIGYLFSKIEVGDKEVALLAEACLPYLKKEQPKMFQEAALKTVHSLSYIDPDAVWLYYNEMFSNEEVLEPPYSDLYAVKFLHSCGSGTEQNPKL